MFPYHYIIITLPLHLNLLKLHGFIYSFKHNRTSFDNGEVNVFLRYVGKQSNGLPCFIRNCAMNGPKAFQLRGILNNQWDFGQSFLGLGLCVTYCEKTSYDENCQINSFAKHVYFIFKLNNFGNCGEIDKMSNPVFKTCSSYASDPIPLNLHLEVYSTFVLPNLICFYCI